MSNAKTSIIPFSFEGHEVRAIHGDDGQPWFPLRDVLKAMGTSTPTNVAKQQIAEGLGDGYNTIIPIQDRLGRAQQVTVINEPAVTFLVAQSRTEAGKRLNRFIHADVLPTIRKIGGYGDVDMTLVQQAAAAAAMAAVQQVLSEQIEAALTRDPRRAVGDYLPALDVAIREGAPQRRRRGLSQRVSKRLTDYSIQHAQPMRKSPETGRRMFHRDAVEGWLHAEGRALIRAHIDSLQGQGRLKLVG